MRVYKHRLRGLMASAIAKGIPQGLLTDPRFFTLWERHGYHILPASFYSPVPLLSKLNGHAGKQRRAAPGIELREMQQRRLLEALGPIAAAESDELLRFVKLHGLPDGAYAGADMMTLYCLLRHIAPKRVIEVGAGVSTFITGYALILNAKNADVEAEFTSIDPYPNPILADGVLGLTSSIDLPVQDVSPERFEALHDGDVLFIDSTHVCKVGSDVNYLMLDILPRLRPGVWVHFHDIFLPNDYPASWIEGSHRFWNEQYLLHAFLAFNSGFQVELATNHLSKTCAEAFPDIFRMSNEVAEPGSFWIRKVA